MFAQQSDRAAKTAFQAVFAAFFKLACPLRETHEEARRRRLAVFAAFDETTVLAARCTRSAARIRRMARRSFAAPIRGMRHGIANEGLT
jgi:hypothetical protein